MDSIIGELPHLVEGFSTNILSYALVLAAVATITMSLLELIKALFKLRLSYHRNKVTQWLSNSECLNELLVLSVADKNGADALFDQPTDKMMGQIQAATNVVIDFPDRYPALYSFLTDADNSKGLSGSADGDDWKNFITKPDSATEELSIAEIKSAEQIRQIAERKRATSAKARIDHFVTRKLDAFQSQTEYRWARVNQYWSVTLSFILLVVLLKVYLKVPLVPATILSFFGGMMAPLSKDVVTALSGLRAK